MNQSEIIPIGSLVKIKGKEYREYVVIGFGINTTKEMFDYTIVEYPIGITNKESIFFINDDQIEKVIFRGYETEEGDNFNKTITSLKEIISSDLNKPVKDIIKEYLNRKGDK